MKIKLKVFTNESCGCCKEYKPKVEQLKNENKNIEIEYLDIMDVDSEASEYDFKGLPFTVVYIDGMFHHFFVGDMPMERIKEEIGLK